METIYRKVKTAERLPEKEGRYIVQNSDVDHPEYMLFNKTTEAFFGFTIWWLEEVELPDVNSIHDYAFEHRSDFTDSSEFYGFELGADFMRDFIKGKVQLNQTKDTKLTL